MGLAETAELAVNLNMKGNFTQGVKQAQGALGGLRTQANSLKSTILTGVGMGGGIAAFSLATRAIGGVVDYMGSAVNAASDLAESQSKVDQVFSDSADTIHDWASSAARDFGLSKQAALEAAGTFGNFIQALGNTEEQANEMSRGLVELAADLASFNNQDIGEVLIALRSGLAGEAEPMRRLGVSISATRVETNILNKGIARTKEEITDAMKVAERYAIIFEDTTKAQGDFERTSDGLANSQRQLGAALEDLSAAFGERLLPIIEDVVVAINDLINPDPGSPANTFKSWADALMPVTAEVEALGDAVVETGYDLGTLEDLMADTPLGLLNQEGAEAVRMWREHGEAFRDVGVSYYEWLPVLRDLQSSLGLSSDEALKLTLEWVDQTKEAKLLEQATSNLAGRQRQLAIEYREVAGEAEATGATVDDLTEAIERAERQARKMAAAFDTVASTSITDIRSDFKSLQKDIRLAARSRSWATLNRQYKQLIEQRRKFVRQREFDAVAIIDAAIKENREQTRARRLSSLLYRAEAGDKKAQRTLSRQVASDEKRNQKDVQGALKDTLAEVEALKEAAKDGALLDVDVNSLALDLLEQRLAVLRGGVVIPLRTTGSVPAATPFQSGTSRPGTVNVNVKNSIDANRTNDGVSRVNATRRSGGYTP